MGEMFSFIADDWFTITGRGTVAVVTVDIGLPLGTVTNQNVLIDGDVYFVTAVEYVSDFDGVRRTEKVGLRIRGKRKLADECPHCPDGHRDPESRSWGAFIGSQRDGDNQPVYIYVMPTNGAHVAESDVEWIRRRLNG